MFVRLLRDCDCTLSYWHDRNWGDRWRQDDWEKRERQETLKGGQMIEALRVRPVTNQSHCCIDVIFMGDMTNSYLNVPLDCIEVLE